MNRLNTAKGELIRSIDQLVEEQELIKEEINNEIKRYMKMCTSNNGSLSGIDYSKDKIKGGTYLIDFHTALQRIDALQLNLNNVLNQIDELKKKRKKIISIYKNDQSMEAKVFFYREVMGYSQAMTAIKLGYSTRQIQRIEKKMRELNNENNP